MLWCLPVTRGNYSHFISLLEIVDDNEFSSSITSVCEEILAYLEMLSTSLNRYFGVGKMETS